MDYAIEVKDLVKIYPGNIRAVDGLSFYVKKGEIFGLLGPNGAGKTTTISILATLLKPTSGTARVMGYDVVRESSSVRRHIGIVFQDFSLDNWLTARENLEFHARIYGIPKDIREKKIDEILRMVGLKERENTLVRYFSGGMKRRLEIARGLLHRPDILFLDEPTLGLDVQTRRFVWEYIRQLNEEHGITILLTTHYMEEADYLCDRILIIDYGRKIAEGTPDELKSLVGGDTLELEGNIPEISNVLREMGFTDIAIRRDRVIVVLKDSPHVIPQIIEKIVRREISVKGLYLRRASLDDVFLKLTGRRIRDEEIRGMNICRLHRMMRMRRGF